MKTYILVFLSVVIGIVSCSQRKDKTDFNNASSLLYLKLEKPDIASLKPLFLSELVDSIGYVQLETTNHCLLPPDINIYLSNDYIFTTSGSDIYQFDRTGKFIRQIGREGQGPGEFKLAKFGIDDTNRQILVASYTNRCPLLFDYDGKFLRNINDSTLSTCFGGVEHLCVGEGCFVLTTPPMDVSHQWFGIYELIVYDYIKNKVTQTLTNRLTCKVDDAKHYNTLRPSLQTLAKRDSIFYYHSFYNDTLYAVSKNDINPFAIIDFGKWKFPIDFLYSPDINKLENADNGNMRIIGIWTYKDKIILNVMYQKADRSVENFLCKYDIRSKKMIYYSGVIINDIDGWQNVSINDFEKGIKVLSSPDDFDDKAWKENAFSKLDKADLKHPEKREKIRQMLQDNRKKEDNPILMIFHLKSEK